MTKTPSIITIGNFDGVHLGHRHLIDTMMNFSQSKNNREEFFQAHTHIKENYTLDIALNPQPIIITFTPHPAAVLGNKFYIPLMTYAKRSEYLHEISQANIQEIPFTKEFAKKTSREFCEFLVKEYNLAILFIGYDLKIGSDRANKDILIQHGKELGFAVYAHEPVLNNSQQIISSTKIREALLEGQIQKANSMLGYAYTLSGIVEHGFKRGGKLLGFPTANLSEDTLIVPQKGVYATKVKILDNKFPLQYNAVTNIGYNPTFNGNTRTIETFIIDFDADIYDYQIEVSFYDFIRTEEKCSSLEELKAKLQSDVECAKSFFRGNYE